jgi:hypothetical protein
MTVYVSEQNPRDPRNYAIFWDGENPKLPNGDTNFQYREYPVGYVPKDLPEDTTWPPIQGSVWPGQVPAEYVPEAPAPEVVAPPAVAADKSPAPTSDPFAVPDKVLEELTAPATIGVKPDADLSKQPKK